MKRHSKTRHTNRVIENELSEYGAFREVDSQVSHLDKETTVPTHCKTALEFAVRVIRTIVGVLLYITEGMLTSLYQQLHYPGCFKNMKRSPVKLYI